MNFAFNLKSGYKPPTLKDKNKWSAEFQQFIKDCLVKEIIIHFIIQIIFPFSHSFHYSDHLQSFTSFHSPNVFHATNTLNIFLLHFKTSFQNFLDFFMDFLSIFVKWIQTQGRGEILILDAIHNVYIK